MRGVAPYLFRDDNAARARSAVVADIRHPSLDLASVGGACVAAVGNGDDAEVGCVFHVLPFLGLGCAGRPALGCQ